MKLLLAIELIRASFRLKNLDWVLIDSEARQRGSPTVSYDAHCEVVTIVELLEVKVDAVVARIHRSTDVGDRLVPLVDYPTIFLIKSHLQSCENVNYAIGTRPANREVCRA